MAGIHLRGVKAHLGGVFTLRPVPNDTRLRRMLRLDATSGTQHDGKSHGPG